MRSSLDVCGAVGSNGLMVTAGLCVAADETLAESHEKMAAVTHFIANEKMPPSVVNELKGYFNVNAQQV
jgi:hypothetical protein